MTNTKKYLIATLSGILAAAALVGFASLAQARIYNPSSGGITSLNGLSGATQTFTNDTNVTISSSGTAHTLGWSGSLATSRGGTGTTTWLTNSVPYFNGTRMTESTSLTFNGTALGVATATPGQSAVFGVNGAVFVNGTIYSTNFYDTALTGSGCVGETAGLLNTSNCVSSLASSGSSITVSSPTGNVDVSLNMAKANTWTATQAFAGLSFTNATGSSVYASGSSTIQTLFADRVDVANGRARACNTRLTDAAAITIDMSGCNAQEVVLGGNRTIYVTSTTTGVTITLYACQDTTGSRTLTWTSTTIRWQGGSAPTLTTTGGKCDLIILKTGTSTDYLFGQASTNF